MSYLYAPEIDKKIEGNIERYNGEIVTTLSMALTQAISSKPIR